MNYDCKNMIRIRKALRLTQDYMCELLGISRVSYTRREKGQTTFKVKEMKIIAEDFSKRMDRRLTIDDLFFS